MQSPSLAQACVGYQLPPGPALGNLPSRVSSSSDLAKPAPVLAKLHQRSCIRGCDQRGDESGILCRGAPNAAVSQSMRTVEQNGHPDVHMSSKKQVCIAFCSASRKCSTSSILSGSTFLHAAIQSQALFL